MKASWNASSNARDRGSPVRRAGLPGVFRKRPQQRHRRLLLRWRARLRRPARGPRAGGAVLRPWLHRAGRRHELERPAPGDLRFPQTEPKPLRGARGSSDHLDHSPHAMERRHRPAADGRRARRDRSKDSRRRRQRRSGERAEPVPSGTPTSHRSLPQRRRRSSASCFTTTTRRGASRSGGRRMPRSAMAADGVARRRRSRRRRLGVPLATGWRRPRHPAGRQSTPLRPPAGSWWPSPTRSRRCQRRLSRSGSGSHTS